MRGYIYKFSNDLVGDYIGSTFKNIEERKKSHKSSMNGKGKNLFFYDNLINNNLNIDDCEIFLLEEIDCNSKSDLLKREQYWMDGLKPINNKIRAYLDPLLKRRLNAIYMYNLRKNTPRDKYKCSKCNYCTNRKDKLNDHFKTLKHKKK